MPQAPRAPRALSALPAPPVLGAPRAMSELLASRAPRVPRAPLEPLARPALAATSGLRDPWALARLGLRGQRVDLRGLQAPPALASGALLDHQVSTAAPGRPVRWAHVESRARLGQEASRAPKEKTAPRAPVASASKPSTCWPCKARKSRDMRAGLRAAAWALASPAGLHLVNTLPSLILNTCRRAWRTGGARPARPAGEHAHEAGRDGTG